MRKVVFLLALLLLPGAVRAQVELIVQVTDDAPSALRTALGGGDRAGALFDAVTAVHPVLRARAAGKRSGPLARTFVLSLPDSAAFRALRDRWQAAAGVAFAQPNHRYRIDGARAADPLSDSLDHFAVIRLPEAWAVTTGRPEVRIGQVDTGLFFDHPDLTGQVWINPGEDLDGDGRAGPADFNGIDDDGNGLVDDVHGYDFVDRPGVVEQGDFHTRDPDPSEDEHPGGGRGHGTTVAGVLVAARDNGVGIAGVAPGARLVPLRAFGADGQGDDDDIAAAIVYAADLGLDVVNLSFGDVFYSPLMHEAIRYAVDRGTVVVASAGNVGGDDPHYPSDYPEVLSVAWLTEDGTAIAGRGTHGLGIDLGAPGSFIYTTLMPSDPASNAVTDLYGRRSGSSMAAPMVSATVALLRSLDPSLTPASVRSILTASARDIEAAGWDHRTGAGLLDAAAALLRALPARTEIVSPPHNGGVSDGVVPVVGTALDPSFEAWTLSYAPGDGDPGEDWTLIAGPIDRQVRADTLARWDVGALPEGVYTLRLAVILRTGNTVEDRRRLFVDHTPPVVTVHLLEPGLVGGLPGVVGDVETDDLTDLSLTVTRGGEAERVDSDRRARRHGIDWQDAKGTGGEVTVRLTARNVAGLETVVERTLTVAPLALNEALFEEQTLAVPHGFLLPRATDFDGDGLLEITFNRYRDGWLGDTLATYEWAGDDFRPAQRVVANVFPRDVGDSDGDGLLELLTQVGGATLVLEQPDAGRFPFVTAFVDTTGLANPFSDDAAFGARITDLDGDGKGELLVHNTSSWRLLEYNGTAYMPVATLENPTGVGNTELDENSFQEPEALIADFDGDGRMELIVGDSDGDWIRYETTGNDAYTVVDTFETPRYNAGSRFARGDFDGDGREEAVTFTQNWTQVTRENEREPDVGRYYFWDFPAGGPMTLTGTFSIAGRLSRHGAMATADFDGDGRDELVVAHAPDLYVLSRDAGGAWSVIYRRPLTDDGIRSIALVTADFDGDGMPEIVAAGADEKMHRFTYRAAFRHTPVPQWTGAYAVDAGRVALAWQAPGADSVTVLGGAPGQALDPLGTTTAASLVLSRTEAVELALRGWYAGVASPLSQKRFVRPHTPAALVEVTYPDPATVLLRFTEALRPPAASQFRLDAGASPEGVVLTSDGRGVRLRFGAVPPSPDTLRWTGLRDREGTPVGDTATEVRFPPRVAGTLIVASWEILDAATLALTFSEALDPVFATDVANYRIRPAGQIASVDFDPALPEQVVLHVPGVVLGATGLVTAIEVLRMQTPDGNTLAAEGAAIRLVQAAADLRHVYVFPNPYRDGGACPGVMIAGLPPVAAVEVLSVSGTHVRSLEEADGDGGVLWDLKDESGREVPSGIYLVRVSAPDQNPVIRKAAIIR